MAGKPYLIPFNCRPTGELYMMEWTNAKEGQVSGQPGAPTYGRMPELWRKNDEFDATLKLTGYHRDRSSGRVTVQNVLNNEIYSMSFSMFYDMVLKLGVENGMLRGRWKFRKHGSSFGLVGVV